MSVDRRSLLKYSAALPLASMAGGIARAADTAESSERADYTLRIATGLVELSPEHIVSTTLYNGQFPGPLMRLTEGKTGRCRYRQRHRHIIIVGYGAREAVISAA